MIGPVQQRIIVSRLLDAMCDCGQMFREHDRPEVKTKAFAVLTMLGELLKLLEAAK